MGAITVIELICEPCQKDQHEDCRKVTKSNVACECEVRHSIRRKGRDTGRASVGSDPQTMRGMVRDEKA
jgi:hypothetical protein